MRLARELAIETAQALQIEIALGHQGRAHQILPQIDLQQPQGGGNPGVERDDDLGDRQLPGNSTAYIGPAPPKGQSANVRGSYPRSMETRRMPCTEVVDRHAQDGIGGLDDQRARVAWRPSSFRPAQPRLRPGPSRTVPARGQVEPAEQELGIGRRRLGSRRAVAGRAGTRPHSWDRLAGATGVDPGDRPPPAPRVGYRPPATGLEHRIR